MPFELHSNCLQMFLIWRRLKFCHVVHGLILSKTIPGFYVSAVEVIRTVGKGEIAGNEQFLLFPLFSTHLENFLPFSSSLKFSSANSFSLEESKICCLEKIK